MVCHKKFIIWIKFFCHHQKFYLFKNTFKEALRYLFNVVKTVFYLKPNFNLKVDHETCNLKNLEEILKTWK